MENKSILTYVMLWITLVLMLAGAPKYSYAEEWAPEETWIISNEAPLAVISDEATISPLEIIEEIEAPQETIEVKATTLKSKLTDIPVPEKIQNITISQQASQQAENISNRDVLRMFVKNKRTLSATEKNGFDWQDFVTAWKILSHNHSQKNYARRIIDKQRFIEIYLRLK